VATVYSGTQKTFSVYINGHKEEEMTSGDWHFCPPSLDDGTIRIGPSSGRGHLTGVIRDVRIWQVALSEQDLIASMKSPIITPTPVLLGWWPLSEGTGNIATDQGLNHLNGEMTGTQWILEGSNQVVEVCLAKPSQSEETQQLALGVAGLCKKRSCGESCGLVENRANLEKSDKFGKGSSRTSDVKKKKSKKQPLLEERTQKQWQH